MRSESPLPPDLVLREFQFPTDYSQVIELWKNAGPGIHLRRSDTREEIAKKTKTDKEAVGLGIGFEKESIVFYEGIKRAIPEYDIKAIEELIAQEENHLRQLLDLKKNL